MIIEFKQANIDWNQDIHDFLKENNFNDICLKEIINNLTLVLDEKNTIIGLIWLELLDGIAYIHEFLISWESRKSSVFKEMLKYIYNKMIEKNVKKFINTVDIFNVEMVNFEIKRGAKYLGQKMVFSGNIENYYIKINTKK